MAGQAVTMVVQTALDDLNTALRIRDLDIVQHFHKRAVFIGSEPGEFASGRAQLQKLFGTIFSSSASVQFSWTSVEAFQAGDTAWFYADGAVLIMSPAGDRRRPYGLSGVLRHGRKGWRWRLFHGSEPWSEPAPPQ